MISALAIATLLGGGSCTLVDATHIEAPDGRLTLSEVIEGDCPALIQVGDLVVAALPRGIDRVLVSRAALAALIRRRVPSLAIAPSVERNEQEVELLRARTADIGAGPECFELARAVATDAPLTRDAVTLTPCAPARTPLALAYDSQHAIVRAAEAGDAGRYLGPLMGLPENLIEPGEPLQLRVIVGPVTIARAVVAVQPVQNGDTLFVRDAEGHVFSVPSASEDARQP